MEIYQCYLQTESKNLALLLTRCDFNNKHYCLWCAYRVLSTLLISIHMIILWGRYYSFHGIITENLVHRSLVVFPSLMHITANMRFEPRSAWFQVYDVNYFSVHSWTNHLTSLSLGFVIWKIEKIFPPL